MKTFSRAAALLLLVGVGACDVAQAGTNGGVLSGTQGNVDFALSPVGSGANAGLVNEGENNFALGLVDAHTMKPITGAMVTLHTLMPAMGHQNSDGLVQEMAPGMYAIHGVVFDMPGDWTVRIQVRRGLVMDEVAFPFNVP